MLPHAPNPASAAARTGSGEHHKRLASDFSGNRLSALDIQAQILARREIAAARRRRQRQVERVHQLGPSPLYHLLTDLDRGKPVWPTVEAYARLDAVFVCELGGDRFAPPLLRLVDGGSE